MIWQFILTVSWDDRRPTTVGETVVVSHDSIATGDVEAGAFRPFSNGSEPVFRFAVDPSHVLRVAIRNRRPGIVFKAVSGAKLFRS